MAFTVIATGGAAASSSTSTVTTGSIDCTGADLIIIAVNNTGPSFPGGVSDNKGNTYTVIGSQVGPGSPHGAMVTFLACGKPTVSSSQTFTFNTGTALLPAIAVLAVSGSAATSSTSFGADQFNSDTANGGTTCSSGSITPGANNELWVSCGTDLQGTTAPTPTNGTLGFQTAGNSGFSRPLGLSYLIQTVATAVSETWSLGGSSVESAALIVSFFEASGGGGSSFLVNPGTDGGMRPHLLGGCNG